MRTLSRRWRSARSASLPRSCDGYRAAAERSARALGHDHLGTEHMLLALALDADTAAARALARLGVDAEDVRRAILTLVGSCIDPSKRPIDSDALRSLGIELDDIRGRIEAAFGSGALDPEPIGDLRVTGPLAASLELACRRSPATAPDSGDVLMALMAIEEGVAAQILRRRGIEPGRLRGEITT